MGKVELSTVTATGTTIADCSVPTIESCEEVGLGYTGVKTSEKSKVVGG